MTEVSEAAMAKRRQLIDTLIDEDRHMDPEVIAFARFIQRVSNAAAIAKRNCEVHGDMPETVHLLGQFILPEPVDPLVEIIEDLGTWNVAELGAQRLRDMLAKRGLKIVSDQ